MFKRRRRYTIWHHEVEVKRKMLGLFNHILNAFLPETLAIFKGICNGAGNTTKKENVYEFRMPDHRRFNMDMANNECRGDESSGSIDF
ncbi:hypothetical protein [Peribacillus simplex]|uniref:hypothetical protein n=1 Tax=Peribacillus simplex TaxID=1478 RepID=UPI0021A9F14A|nr:hypothetical protein [Peribacillus simplex]